MRVRAEEAKPRGPLLAGWAAGADANEDDGGDRDHQAHRLALVHRERSAGAGLKMGGWRGSEGVVTGCQGTEQRGW